MTIPAWTRDPGVKAYAIPKGAIGDADIIGGQIHGFVYDHERGPTMSDWMRSFSRYPDKDRDGRVWLVERECWNCMGYGCERRGIDQWVPCPDCKTGSGIRGTGKVYDLVREDAEEITQRLTDDWEVPNRGFGTVSMDIRVGVFLRHKRNRRYAGVRFVHPDGRRHDEWRKE